MVGSENLGAAPGCIRSVTRWQRSGGLGDMESVMSLIALTHSFTHSLSDCQHSRCRGDKIGQKFTESKFESERQPASTEGGAPGSGGHGAPKRGGSAQPAQRGAWSDVAARVLFYCHRGMWVMPSHQLQRGKEPCLRVRGCRGTWAPVTGCALSLFC